jgi:hypothetical protein
MAWMRCEPGTAQIQVQKRYELRELQNRIEENIYTYDREEMTGGWRKLHAGSFLICSVTKCNQGKHITGM